MIPSKSGKQILFSFISIATYAYLAYFLDRTNFHFILLCFAFTFGAYVYFIRSAKKEQLKFYLALGIFFRVIFLFSTPTLSDDYFRFIWDGQLLVNGQNPFDFLPTEVAINFPNKAELLAGMNSPNYYTIYPPLAQLIYFLSTWLSPNSILGSIVVIRTSILLAEIGTLALLPKLLKVLKINPINSLWYILNPIVIVELVGNLHFEGLMIFFFLLAVYLLVLQKEKIAAIPWAFAAAVKLIPIFFLPIIIRKIAFKKAIIFYVLFALVFVSLWSLFYNATFFAHFLNSIELYYKTFEFNASVYYVIRWIGFQYQGYNVIQTVGPWLSKIAWLGLIIFQLKRNPKTWVLFFKALLFALTFYYALALIVHPWYICFLVFLAVFTPYRYAVLWSATTVLSYWAYSNSDYHENYLLIAIEYTTVLALLIYEVFLRKQKA